MPLPAFWSERGALEAGKERKKKTGFHRDHTPPGVAEAAAAGETPCAVLYWTFILILVVFQSNMLYSTGDAHPQRMHEQQEGRRLLLYCSVLYETYVLYCNEV